MTALEYMKRQVCKHRDSLARAALRGASAEELANINAKIGYYREAAEALMGFQASAPLREK